ILSMKKLILSILLLSGLSLHIDISHSSLTLSNQAVYAQNQYFAEPVWIVASSGGGGSGPSISTINLFMMDIWQNYINNLWGAGNVFQGSTSGAGPTTPGASSREDEGLTEDGTKEIVLCSEDLTVSRDTIGIVTYLTICIQNIREKVQYTDMNGDTHTITLSYPNPIHAYSPNPQTGPNAMTPALMRIMLKDAYDAVITKYANQIATGLHVVPSENQFHSEVRSEMSKQNGNLGFTAIANPNQSTTCNDATYDGKNDCY
ncbi:MAG: hypothetical protein AAFY70_03285, partial [Bacteroidota bacterium]